MFPAVLFAAALVAPSASCPVERASYVLRGSDGVTARFDRRTSTADWAADVAFSIHSAKTGATVVFLPYSGNGQGIRTHLASVDDSSRPPAPDSSAGRPTRDLDYLASNAAYRFDQAFVAQAGRPAPEHLLLPGLQDALWRRTADHGPEAVPMAFFDLVACRT